MVLRTKVAIILSDSSISVSSALDFDLTGAIKRNVATGPVMNTCKEIPYEELNTLQVSASFVLSYSVVYIISLELHRSTGRKLLYERGVF